MRTRDEDWKMSDESSGLGVGEDDDMIVDDPATLISPPLVLLMLLFSALSVDPPTHSSSELDTCLKKYVPQFGCFRL